jgi:alkanesulfonate monooxygenase SsuD/methylene tetrahydromethanopterin reductase-like flavin-dependent oxidoreductase (luciferase family)
LYSIRFDMRAPAVGAAATDLYAAAIDMCAWAEQHGCLAAVLCEHHGSPDGYLPAPLVLASAVAARTLHLPINVVAVVPLYDPVRLAEEMAVVDIISNGRVSYTLALGYRREEYEHFGIDFVRRGRIADENVELLRKLFAGEGVVHEGRHIAVTPRPATPGGPMLMWGGGSLAAARRAGRYGLGLLANGTVPGMKEAYEAACRERGAEPGPMILPDRETPTTVFVADDVDQAWEEVGPRLFHDARVYADWNPGNDTSAGISEARSIDELRATSHSHKIMTVAEAVEKIRGGEILNLSPLCGGLPPDIAWPYLKRVAHTVLPQVASRPPDGAGAGWSEALTEVVSTMRTQE